MTSTDHTALENGVFQHEQLELAESLAQLGNRLPDRLDRAGRKVLGDTTRADVGVVHPQPGNHLEQAQDALPLTEAHGHHGRGTQFHAPGSHTDQVAGDPVELHHEHANGARAGRDVVGDAEQLLDREAVGRLGE